MASVNQFPKRVMTRLGYWLSNITQEAQQMQRQHDTQAARYDNEGW